MDYLTRPCKIKILHGYVFRQNNPAIVGAEIIGISPGIGQFLNGAAVKGQYEILTFGIIGLLLFLFTINKLIWLPLLKRSHEYSHE